jgi:hypothetical protein
VRQAADSQTVSHHALSALSELLPDLLAASLCLPATPGDSAAQDLTQGFFADLIESRATLSNLRNLWMPLFLLLDYRI